MHDLLECPLCAWTYRVTTVQTAPPALANVFGVGIDALTSMWAHQEAANTERELEKHLQTHPPKEWLPALMAARAQRDALMKEAIR